MVENTFFRIKQKYGEGLKGKSFPGQQNELMAKILAYNLSVLIRELFRLGIDLGISEPPGQMTLLQYYQN